MSTRRKVKSPAVLSKLYKQIKQAVRRHMLDKLKWYIYRDKNKKYRWRAVASNGKIVGASSQGYKDTDDCRENGNLFKKTRSMWNKIG